MSDINFAGYIDDTGKRFVGDFQSEGHVGPPGYTPQKGVDYFTSEDVEEVKDLVKTETGCEVEMTLDPTTYILTVKLITSDGTILNTETVDLPIEAMIVNGTYDSSTKEIVLTLQSGSVIRVPIGDVISGLQEEITVDNKLSSDLVDDTGNTNRFMKSISADTTMYGLSAGIYQTIGTITLKYANTRTFQSKNGILIISEYNKIKSFVEASDGALHTGVIDIGTGYCKTSDLTEKLINNISAFVKDSLDYSTSGTDYALSAYQGYLLDQNKQDKLTAGSNINISGSTIAVSGIENGAEVNIIEEVQVDGTPLEVTNKAVNIVGMAELKAENEQLLDQIPTATATGETITVNDSSNLPLKSFELQGNATQNTSIMYYKCVGTETGDYYFVYDSTNYQFTMPTINANEILTFNTSTLKLYQGTTEITTTTASTGTLITLSSTPSPSYPQTIHVVTGNNTVKLEGKNLFGLTASDFNNGTSVGGGKKVTLTLKPNTKYTLSSNDIRTSGNADIWFNGTNSSDDGVWDGHPITKTTDSNGELYIAIRTIEIDNIFAKYWIQLEEGESNTTYTPYVTSQQVTLPLGDMQLCKISGTSVTYSDKIYKYNGKWYLLKNIDKYETTGDENISLFSETTMNFRFRGSNIRTAGAAMSNYFNKGTYQGGSAQYPSVGISDGNYLYIRYNTAEIATQYGITDVASLKTWLTANKPIIYYILNIPTITEITDTALITALEQVEAMTTYKTTTNAFTITVSDNATPTLVMEYRQDIGTYIHRLETLEARVELLEQ